MDAAAPSPPQQHVCDFCAKTLTTKYGLARHLKSCKAAKISEPPAETAAQESVQAPVTEESQQQEQPPVDDKIARTMQAVTAMMEKDLDAISKWYMRKFLNMMIHTIDECLEEDAKRRNQAKPA
jgi:uncharacterized membrane protein YheB (UPF0754 family)